VTPSTDSLARFAQRCVVIRARRGVHPDIWNQVLYDLCRQYPTHDNKEALIAKVGIIGRSYASQIERGVKTSVDRPSALDAIADHLWKHRQRVQRIFGAVASLAEPLNPSSAEQIISEHGRFVTLVGGVTRFDCVSFASKYMHFHCPAVPIYDSRASKALRSLVPWRSVDPPFDFAGPANRKYYRFVIRFLRAHEFVRHKVHDVTVKFLDVCLIDHVKPRKANIVARAAA
jgi:hypothetical protein